MTVRFTNLALNGGGGVRGVTQFVDAFGRGDTTQGLGPGWLGMPRSSLQSSQAQPMCRIVSQQLVNFTQGAGAGSKTPGVIFFPVALLTAALYGLAQYAELTYFSRSGADSDLGAAVMVSGDTASQNQQGYMLAIEASTGNLRIDLLTSTRTGLATVPYTPVQGDVLRLEVVPGATSNALTVRVNGAAALSYVDSNAARPVRTGYPAIWNWAMTIGALDTYTRWAGGIL